MEAVRVAHQGAVESQQVEAQRQAFVAKQAEGLHEVQRLEHAEGTHLDPEGHPGGRPPHGHGHTEGRESEESAPEAASSAEGHLDLLA
jgi:hypothetical protein